MPSEVQRSETKVPSLRMMWRWDLIRLKRPVRIPQRSQKEENDRELSMLDGQQCRKENVIELNEERLDRQTNIPMRISGHKP